MLHTIHKQYRQHTTRFTAFPMYSKHTSQRPLSNWINSFLFIYEGGSLMKYFINVSKVLDLGNHNRCQSWIGSSTPSRCHHLLVYKSTSSHTSSCTLFVHILTSLYLRLIVQPCPWLQVDASLHSYHFSKWDITCSHLRNWIKNTYLVLGYY